MRNIIITFFLAISYSILETGYGQRNNYDTENCGAEKFQCKSGECLASVLLCDGRPDCKDQSDETYVLCHELNILCPDYAFKCKYGACIDGDLTCNGVRDCIDNSDETLLTCNSSYDASLECSDNQFKCDDGQCISKGNLCDGTVDCNDGSDETVLQCETILCEPIFFKCRYGACIDGDLKCNGYVNCADGSDEDLRLCNSTSTINSTLSTHPVTTPETPIINKPRQFCITPPQPQNGSWKLCRSQCFTKESVGNNSEGIWVQPGMQIKYSCKPGYKIEGSSVVFCTSEGEWSNIPKCIEVYCNNLNSASTKAEYVFSGPTVGYYPFPKPNTKAKLSCNNGYKKSKRALSFSSVTCNENGEWEPVPLKCDAECGSSPANVKPLILNGEQANITDFPWHATLYKVETPGGPKKFICGATIIHERLLITAAHCVFNVNTLQKDDPSKYYVAAGNVFRDYDYPFHDKVVKKTRVEDIFIQCAYEGFHRYFTADIAILKIAEPFSFTALLQPICLDLSNTLLENRKEGKVAGFGRTASGSSSFILQSLTVLYVDSVYCLNESRKYNTQQYLTNDKICTGYINGSSVCEGDSGGGLIFRFGDFWYLKGIVSINIGTTDSLISQCNGNNSYTAYTSVSFYTDWIQLLVHNVERNKTVSTC